MIAWLRHRLLHSLSIATFGVAIAGGAAAQGSGSATLDAVRARGQLLCGTSGTIPGFALPDSAGVMRGLDADSCRAIAAAALGDATKVRFVLTSTQTRFTALQSGEIDVLLRNTGWSLTREGNLGLAFASVNFWDGAAFMVKASAGLKSAKELDGATVCVLPGTSTELIVADWFRANGMRFSPVLIDGNTEIQRAFLAGRCDAYVTDGSQLAGFRFQQGPRAADLTILPERISSEPSGAVVRKGDDKWFDLVRWTHFALVSAEQEGVGSGDVAGLGAATNPDVRRLLGLESNLGSALGVGPRWAAQAIEQVGNYGEMYTRNILLLGIERGQNALWTKGGLQFTPPLR
ncbi:MAG: amino acid ABC transporter substrate-binding protein [Gemmatimonadaceae bacterium]|nr:amino acid ABC transporter substrate-binding protein [Acetobacteraceae bacterium]